MKFLFVTTARLDRVPAGDHSTRYRAFHVAEALRSRGHRADVAMLRELPRDAARGYDVVSVLRPRVSPALDAFLRRSRQAGAHLVADLDDLVVDPELAACSPLVVNGFAKERRVRGYFASHREALASFDAVTVSTPPLLAAVRRVAPELDVRIVRNGLSRAWLRHRPPPSERDDGVFRVVYLAGTRSHDADLASVEDALAAFVAAAPERRLRLVGDVACEAARFPAGRLERAAGIGYFALPALVGDCHASIAPLVPNAFNAAKSRIKFIESAALGLPHVASPIADLADHDVDGLRLATDPAHWFDALEALATASGGTRRAAALRDHADERCTADAAIDALLAVARREPAERPVADGVALDVA